MRLLPNALLFSLLLVSPVLAQDVTQRENTYTIEKLGISLTVLPQDEYDQLIASNPRNVSNVTVAASVPKAALRSHVQELVTGLKETRNWRLLTEGDADEEERSGCGEIPTGDLFLALRSPDLDEDSRVATLRSFARGIPNLDPIETIGHFRFFYQDRATTAGTHAVSRDDIVDTANILNSAWDFYATHFAEPKHRVIDGKKLIDIFVFDLEKRGRRGVTNSNWDSIHLDSVLCVSDPCQRRSTAVHELFHRVQYEYNYESGTSLKWASEGTAAWSQRLLSPDSGDYLRRMNDGLRSGEALIGRSYDAIHFWAYFGDQLDTNERGAKFVHNCWSEFKANPSPSSSDKMLNSTTSVIERDSGKPMDEMVAQWHHANARKDFTSVAKFDYPDDEKTVTCSHSGEEFGPLRKVGKILHRIRNTVPSITSNEIAPTLGARHHQFRLSDDIKKVKISVNPAKEDQAFFVSIIATTTKLVDGELVTNVVQERLPKEEKEFDFECNFPHPGDNRIIVNVMGGSRGGAYEIKAQKL